MPKTDLQLKDIPPHPNLPKLEEEVLKFWDETNAFQKSIALRSKKNRYVFYDGPPFATGLPHYGHIVASTIKDIIPRYFTMKGKRVERKWGWDCHGLPIENIAEKELKIKRKKDIETLGVAKFNEVCRSKVLSYVADWKKIIKRLGRWVDMEHDYKTMDLTFMESVWWVFKQLYDQGLIYEDYRSMHICPRCETTLSQSEVTEGYKEITDISVITKFKLLQPKQILGAKIKSRTVYALAWTTTPWTLPGNVLLAVNPKLTYVIFSDHESKSLYLAAQARVKEVMGDEPIKIITKIKGEDLLGLKYEPLFPYFKETKRAFQIVSADFVSAEDGTGIVHVAPAFGEDDFNLGKQVGVPLIHHVDAEGKFIAAVTDFAGMKVKPKEDPTKADVEIIKWLAKNNKLFAKKKIKHSYPHCWRCDTPLLNYATSSYFVRVTALKERMLTLAKKINWMPPHIKKGRWHNWLKGAKDWSISRQRYWASVIPIWKCDQCGQEKVFGSIAEIEKKLGSFLVMRHGEAENNIKEILSSKLNDGMPLTKKGETIVKKSAQKLIKEKIDLIISSDLERAKQTSKIVAQATGAKIIYDARLREIDAGDYDGSNYAQIAEFLKSWGQADKNVHFPNGESWQTIQARIKSFYNDLFTQYKDRHVLVVSHGDVLVALQALISHKDFYATVREIHSSEGEYIEKGRPMKLKYKLIDLHKHVVDTITFACDQCNGTMHRVPDVLDTWFDSGSMPYGQVHYPFENKAQFEANFPAEFIAEGIDQTRAWFYYLHAIATGIKDSNAFQNVIVNGIVLAEDGKKMSKRLKNYPDPSKLLEQYGGDSLRLYLASSPVMKAENLNFSEKGVAQVRRKVFLILWNMFSFHKLYHQLGSMNLVEFEKFEPTSNNILDQWVISLTHSTLKQVTDHLDHYDLVKSSRVIIEFVNHLSTWYLRRSRDRLREKQEAQATFRYVLALTCQMLAPFAPFMSELIFNNLIDLPKDKPSIHHTNWPKVKVKLINAKLESVMIEIRKVAEKTHALRKAHQVKVKQPLAKLTVISTLKQPSDRLLKVLAEEVNVKTIDWQKGDLLEVKLDFNLTPKLKAEGEARELIREIQKLRKKSNLKPEDRAHFRVRQIPQGWQQQIETQTHSQIELGDQLQLLNS